MAKRTFNEEQMKGRNEAVKRFAEKHDRINVMLPLGTKDRIYALGYTGNDFAKNVILAELDRLEEYENRKKNS